MNSKHCVLTIVVFLFIYTTEAIGSKSLQGQAKTDSLLAELPNSINDTNHVNLLFNLSKSYYKSDPETGIRYGKEAIEMTNKLGWDKGLAYSYSAVGLNYLFGKGHYNKALNYFFKAEKIFTELDDQAALANLYGNLGSCYRSLSNYPKAIEYLLKSIKYNEESGDKRLMAIGYGNLGLTYYNQLDYDKGLEYLTKALELNEELDNKPGIALSYGNLGSIYLRKEDYTKALEYYKNAYEINKIIDNKTDIAHNLGNIGIVYSMKSNYGKGIEYFERALKIHRELGNDYGTAIVLGNIGELYLLSVNNPVDINSESQLISLDREVSINKGINYVLEAKAIFEKIQSANETSNMYNVLHNLYYKKGMYKKSIDAHRKFKTIKDSVFSEKSKEKIAELEKARENDLKQKEIEKQKIRIAEQDKRERLILYFSIGFIIAMLIVMTIIYRLLKRSDKLLYNVLPVSIAKRLKKKEHPISDYFTQASIVFIDIVNFTELARDEDPRRVVEALNKIFTNYDTIANKYGLEKIKTIGDSYMAAAGIPEIQKDNTHRAAQMALEVKELMKNYHTSDGTRIEVRIGLDCGPVVAGVIGENKFIYDMWSDAVNTASRMESSSKAGEIHVSERFKDAVSEYENYTFTERDEIEIKGKGKMKTYFISN